VIKAVQTKVQHYKEHDRFTTLKQKRVQAYSRAPFLILCKYW